MCILPKNMLSVRRCRTVQGEGHALVPGRTAQGGAESTFGQHCADECKKQSVWCEQRSMSEGMVWLRAQRKSQEIFMEMPSFSARAPIVACESHGAANHGGYCHKPPSTFSYLALRCGDAPEAQRAECEADQGQAMAMPLAAEIGVSRTHQNRKALRSKRSQTLNYVRSAKHMLLRYRIQECSPL